MSKGFNMIGWRLGWVCGHARIVQAFADVKDNSDSGQFMAIQKAAAAALDDADDSRAHARRSTSRRLEKLVATLGALRLQVQDARRHVLPLHARARRALGRRPRRSRTPRRPAST